MDRVILADCCEDWIIEWGGFYAPGTAFSCPECATAWSASGDGAFKRADGPSFVHRERKGPAASYPYLAAQDGHEPNVERCCAKILLRHGDRMTDGPFSCPVCGTKWERRTERLHGLRVPVFAKAGRSEPLTVQAGRTRPFLVVLSQYSPPRD